MQCRLMSDMGKDFSVDWGYGGGEIWWLIRFRSNLRFWLPVRWWAQGGANFSRLGPPAVMGFGIYPMAW